MSHGDRVSRMSPCKGRELAVVTEQFIRDTGAVYEAVGRFVVRFGQFTHLSAMEFATLPSSRPFAMRWQVATEMTAGQLFGAIESALRARVRAPEDEALFKSVMTDIRALVTDHRNYVIHGALFVGWGAKPDDDFTQVDGVKIRPRREQPGNAPPMQADARLFTPATFDQLTCDVLRLHEALSVIISCVTLDLRESNNLHFDGGRVAVTRPKPLIW